MNKEDIKLGTTFIITKGLDIDIINKCIKQKVEFTIVDLSSARGANPLVHCSIGNCSDQDLLDSFKKYYCEDKSSPGYGYLKISVGDLDRENMQVIYNMKLDDIGFLEIIEERAKNFSDKTFSYCEWIITSKCNFDCPYCNKFTNQKDLSLEEIKETTDLLKSFDTKYIHLTGGEPTTRSDLFEIVSYIKSKGIKIGISTNGSKNLDYYTKLNELGVEIFSMSLDAHKASLNKQFTKVDNVFENVVENIKGLSKKAYLNVGVVLNNDNIEYCKDILSFVSDLGVADIRIMTATNYNKIVKLELPDEILNKHPILRYRVNNFNSGLNMRGSQLSECNKCYLVWDDITLVGNDHFPCAVYAREKGKPIGKVSKNLKEDRMKWFENHDSSKDEICLKYCMDFKCRFNRTVEKYLSEKTQSN